MPETTLSRLGWALSGLFALFMLGASVAPKLLGMAVAQETMAALGWPQAPIMLIGSLELLCTLLFLFLWMIRKRIKTPGVMFGIYLILNGLERFAVELIRVNNTYTIFGFHPTQAEIISFLLFLTGLCFIIIQMKRTKRLS